ncbi:MAG: helix-turn-helix transcriptional regulator [Crocinitomix sp.]|nr:helix-turn-helix transcriptional regulator [Crocinitomix sp.]
MRTNLKIRKLRENADLTQEFMANSLKISQSAYAQLESGKNKISEDRLKKISEILAVDMESLRSSEDLKFNIHDNTFNQSSSVIATLNIKNDELYERLLAEKDEQITLLKNTIDKLIALNGSQKN